MNTLKPVTLEDKALFDSYFAKYPPSASELTFTNFFCWSPIKNNRFCEYNDHLIIASVDDDNIQLYPPIGPCPEQIMTEGIADLPYQCFHRIDKELATKVHSCSKLTCDRDNSDYIYQLENLRELKGKKYDGKRNHIKKMEKQNPQVLPLEASHAEACLHIQEKWLEALEGNPSAKNETVALKRALENFDVLGITGVSVFVEDTLAGFAIGEPLNSSTYVEHFEKGLIEYSGVYAYVLHTFVQSIPESYTYLNREQDLGIEGIRKSKESWHPEEFLVEKFTMKNCN